MKKLTGIGMALGLLAASAFGQQAKQPMKAAPTIASVMQAQFGYVEQSFVAAAEAMPADKYDFAPTGPGEFKGVRTFAQEVKHVATANFMYFSTLLQEPMPPDASGEKGSNGPEELQTKEQIVKYLKDSFAYGHKAIATITAQNAVTPLPKTAVSFLTTRLALASFGCTHTFDHYGQIVEYLRMNGIVPPASQGQPPANPGAK
ncbi:MAG TPA: DinB family protein [Candidatus Acidoferrales bacterium]|nr:DinB family protein [Candidatus Acidoferrales bacterium]